MGWKIKPGYFETTIVQFFEVINESNRRLWSSLVSSLFLIDTTELYDLINSTFLDQKSRITSHTYEI